MPEIEKVIEHLQIIRTWAELDGKMGRGMEPKCCLRVAEWVDDALEMLKAQQPRVLNLNEIHRGMVVWLEQYKVPEMLLVIGGSSADGQKCFITEDYNSITPYDEDYNEYWRAWTLEPDDEQRKAVKWDD